jgi:hypothetical protein
MEERLEDWVFRPRLFALDDCSQVPGELENIPRRLRILRKFQGTQFAGMRCSVGEICSFALPDSRNPSSCPSAEVLWVFREAYVDALCRKSSGYFEDAEQHIYVLVPFQAAERDLQGMLLVVRQQAN